MAGGVLSGAAVSYVGDYFPYNKRGWATGWIMSGAAFGQIIGIPLGILIAGRWGFRAPFGIFAVTMAFAFLLVFLKVPQPNVERNTAKITIRKALGRYFEMLRRPGDSSCRRRLFPDVHGDRTLCGLPPHLAGA